MALKSALITGASRGIGHAIALRLSALGIDLFLTGRDEAALREVANQCAEHKVKVGTLCGDLHDHDFRESVLEAASGALGVIDILVNNAGVTSQAAVQNAELSRWRAVMDINFDSALQMSHGVLPGMIERERGAVINISSISGRNTTPGSGIYAASKHAINGFSGCLFEDVREYGIKVSAIMPGFVATDLTARLNKDETRMLQPDDVAAAVEFVVTASPTCCPSEIVLRPQRAV